MCVAVLRPRIREQAPSALETQTRSPEINLIARTQTLAPPIARRHVDRKSVAEDPRSGLALVVADAILAAFLADVRLLGETVAFAPGLQLPNRPWAR